MFALLTSKEIVKSWGCTLVNISLNHLKEKKKKRSQSVTPVRSVLTRTSVGTHTLSLLSSFCSPRSEWAVSESSHVLTLNTWFSGKDSEKGEQPLWPSGRSNNFISTRAKRWESTFVNFKEKMRPPLCPVGLGVQWGRDSVELGKERGFLVSGCCKDVIPVASAST